jgi:hypothetical protein
VSTILFSQLPNVVEHLYQRIAAPPVSVTAQAGATLPLMVAGLLLLLIVALVLFWRMSRQPRSESPASAKTAVTAPEPTAAPPPAPAMVALDFVTESEQRMIFKLDMPTLTIGRASDNDIVVTAPILNADTVSQHHARLRRDPDGFVVRDVGSKNGLAVNGQWTIENLLQDGDRLQFGEVEAIFHQSAGGAA